MEEITLIFIIIVLVVLCIGLGVTVVYLVRWIDKAEKKIDDLSLTVHFATDNYLINERKKNDNSTGELAG